MPNWPDIEDSLRRSYATRISQGATTLPGGADLSPQRVREYADLLTAGQKPISFTGSEKVILTGLFRKAAITFRTRPPISETPTGKAVAAAVAPVAKAIAPVTTPVVSAAKSAQTALFPKPVPAPPPTKEEKVAALREYLDSLIESANLAVKLGNTKKASQLVYEDIPEVQQQIEALENPPKVAESVPPDPAPTTATAVEETEEEPTEEDDTPRPAPVSTRAPRPVAPSIVSPPTRAIYVDYTEDDPRTTRSMVYDRARYEPAPPILAGPKASVWHTTLAIAFFLMTMSFLSLAGILPDPWFFPSFTATEWFALSIPFDLFTIGWVMIFAFD